MESNNSLIKAVNKNVRSSPRKLSLVCNFIVGKNTTVDEKMLEITGYSEQEILILLKELSRNYKGTSDGWSK